MKYEISDKSDNGWVLVKRYGTYSIEDTASMFKELSLLNSRAKATGLLVDHSETSFEKTDLIEVKQSVLLTTIADTYMGFNRCALIIPDGGHGKAAMFKYDLDRVSNMEIAIFSQGEYKSAVHWLTSKE